MTTVTLGPRQQDKIETRGAINSQISSAVCLFKLERDLNVFRWLPNLHIGNMLFPFFRNPSASAFANPPGASCISFG